MGRLPCIIFSRQQFSEGYQLRECFVYADWIMQWACREPAGWRENLRENESCRNPAILRFAGACSPAGQNRRDDAWGYAKRFQGRYSWKCPGDPGAPEKLLRRRNRDARSADRKECCRRPLRCGPIHATDSLRRRVET